MNTKLLRESSKKSIEKYIDLFGTNVNADELYNHAFIEGYKAKIKRRHELINRFLGIYIADHRTSQNIVPFYKGSPIINAARVISFWGVFYIIKYSGDKIVTESEYELLKPNGNKSKLGNLRETGIAFKTSIKLAQKQLAF